MISDKTLAIHKDKLYQGYVAKVTEINGKLRELREKLVSGEDSGNATYSNLKGLKESETFAVNGVYLHEWYFTVLGGGDSNEAPELVKALEEKWGSLDVAIKIMSECAMAARGWMILCWDTKAGRLKQFNADAHNQGGVWGTIPIIVLDVYEHSYFIDYGADRKAYITDFWQQFNWSVAEMLYLKVRDFKL